MKKQIKIFLIIILIIGCVSGLIALGMYNSLAAIIIGIGIGVSMVLIGLYIILNSIID